MITYRDFWLRIERRGDDFWVVSRSPDGECEGPLRLASTTAPDDLAALLQPRAEGARGAGAETRDLAFESAPDEPDAAGRLLFEALFNEGVLEALRGSQGRIGQDEGLRFRIQIDLNDPALARLARLPWELLYDERKREAFGRSPRTLVVRYIDVPRPYEPPPFEAPLRVLIVLANPAGTDPLDLAKERSVIESTWAKLEGVEVTILEHATRASLFAALDAGTYHVLHFMGHGGFDEASGRGALLLEGEQGEARPLLAETLGDTLREVASMRLVVLNACNTGKASPRGDRDPFDGVAAALVMAGMPAVVAMQVPVADRAAVAFAEKFYADLAAGHPVDAAVAAGRKAIYRANPGSSEWATPVLFMRAPDGRLFDVSARAEPLPAVEPEAPAARNHGPVSAPEPPRKAEREGRSGGIKKGLLWALGGAVALVLAVLLIPTGEDVPQEEPPSPAVDVDEAAQTILIQNGYDDPADSDFRFVQGIAENLFSQQSALEREGYTSTLALLWSGRGQRGRTRVRYARAGRAARVPDGRARIRLCALRHLRQRLHRDEPLRIRRGRRVAG